MRRLVLIRHAKSSWDHPSHNDHSRPLNDRGVRAARMLGAWIAGRDWTLDEVLCSTAKRAQQTWAGISEALPDTPRIDDPKLYHASPERMLDRLQTATGETVAMVAHNPGIASFARGLLADAPDDGRFIRYPTGCTTVITFDIADWSALRPGIGTLEALVFPRDLSDRGSG